MSNGPCELIDDTHSASPSHNIFAGELILTFNLSAIYFLPIIIYTYQIYTYYILLKAINSFIFIASTLELSILIRLFLQSIILITMFDSL